MLQYEEDSEQSKPQEAMITGQNHRQSPWRLEVPICVDDSEEVELQEVMITGQNHRQSPWRIEIPFRGHSSPQEGMITGPNHPRSPRRIKVPVSKKRKHFDRIHEKGESSYISLISDEEKEEQFPVYDSRYEEEMQLQEAITASLLSITVQNHGQPTGKTKYSERGESSSSSSSSFCIICMETKPWAEMFRNNTCSHVFCSDCVSKHIAAKVQENISSVPCPDIGCRVALEPEFCRPFVPKEVFERWADALCESMVLASKNSYCPYKDCAALFVDDSKETVREAECLSCRRLFCASCKVPWHAGLKCTEFQKMDKGERGNDDLMLMELAKRHKWKRCPMCKFFVERSEGCLHMTCRCRYQFCYRCGSRWGYALGMCANYSCSRSD